MNKIQLYQYDIRDLTESERSTSKTLVLSFE